MTEDENKIDLSETDWKLKFAKNALEKTDAELLRIQMSNFVDKLNTHQQSQHKNINKFAGGVDNHIKKLKDNSNSLRLFVIVNTILTAVTLFLLIKVMFF